MKALLTVLVLCFTAPVMAQTTIFDNSWNDQNRVVHEDRNDDRYERQRRQYEREQAVAIQQFQREQEAREASPYPGYRYR